MPYFPRLFNSSSETSPIERAAAEAGDGDRVDYA